jgi:hypothetical protein
MSCALMRKIWPDGSPSRAIFHEKDTHFSFLSRPILSGADGSAAVQSDAGNILRSSILEGG